MVPFFLLALVISVVPLPVLATQYCVDAVYGKDTNTGVLSSTATSTRAQQQCWASSTGAYAHINSGSILPGDQILYCQGNVEYQGGMLIGPTSSTSTLGSKAAPIVFGSYSCRNTLNNTVIWPLPRVSRANILPQSTFSPATQWHKVPWTYPNGTVGWVLSYNLSALNGATGNQFIPTLNNRINNGAMVLGGLWINGVPYHEARYPNLVNPNVTHGNDTREFLLLDPSRVKTGPIGWSYYVLSNSTDLYLSIGSWCQMKRVLYGTNDAAWAARGGKSNYYSQAKTIYRSNDFIISSAVLGGYNASTADCSDNGAFVMQMVNCSAPCVPLNYTWDSEWLKTLPVPVSLANTSHWLPTHLYGMGGDTSYYLNWYNVQGGPSGYGGWSMGQILANHSDFLDAPQEYLVIGDVLYVVPADDWTTELLLTNYAPTTVNLTQTAFAHALVDLGINAAPTVVLFNGGQANSAIFGMVGQYGGPLNQFFEVRELELSYSYQGWYTWHCAEFNIHHVVFRHIVNTALFVSGGGVVQGSTDPGQQMSLVSYSNVFENTGAAIYAVATSIQVVNNTFVDTAMVWGTNAGGYVATLTAYDWGNFWGNQMTRAGYVGIASGATLDVAFNTFNHTSAIHLDGGPITTNGLIEWNLVGSADTNMLSGIVGGGSVGLSRGVYGLSDRTTLVNNLLFNVSGQCIFGGNAQVPITMADNICVNSGWQLNPFPATQALAQSLPQVYNNNSIFFLNPILDSSVEYWQQPYQPPFLGLSQGGRWLISNTATNYPLFNGSYLCVGLVEPLTTSQVVTAVIEATGQTAQLYGSLANATLSSSSASGMQFALSAISQPWGPTYLTSIESYIKNAESWAQTNAQNTIFEFGQAHCTQSLDNTVKAWISARNQARALREPAVQVNMTASMSADYAPPQYWPWPCVNQPVNRSSLDSGNGQTEVWVYRGCFQDQATRAIPDQLPGLFSTLLDCETSASALGYDTIGLQSGTQCWAGHSPNYARWGAVLCSQIFGGAWQNQVYQLVSSGSPVVPPVKPPVVKPPVGGSWVYVGCYQDQQVRAIPTELSGNVGTLAHCQQLATVNGLNVIGLQSGAQCWGGLNSAYARYGAAVCSQTFGGAWQNQVYMYVSVNASQLSS
jgi:hypothetical protein